MIHWNTLTEEEQLNTIIQESGKAPVVIFKHSTTCPISATAKDRLERNWSNQHPEAKPYYLDLLSFRSVSNSIAEKFGIKHESPQVLVIRDGKCVYDASHLAINAKAVEAKLA